MTDDHGAEVKATILLACPVLVKNCHLENWCSYMDLTNSPANTLEPASVNMVHQVLPVHAQRRSPH